MLFYKVKEKIRQKINIQDDKYNKKYLRLIILNYIQDQVMDPLGQQNMTIMQNKRAGLEMAQAGLTIEKTIYTHSFVFCGNSSSLERLLKVANNEDLLEIVDSHISVVGIEHQPANPCGFLSTMLLGRCIPFILIIMCMNCWNKCVFSAYSITSNVYTKLDKLFEAPRMRNMILTINDNTFDAEKATILYNLIEKSQIKKFTFMNMAGQYDYNEREFSDFTKNMQPIKQLKNIATDLRWGRKIVQQ